MLSDKKSDFIVIFVGRLLQVIIMLASIRVMTKLLNPEDMGSVYIFTATYAFFVMPFISPLGQYINRHTHRWHEKKMLLDNIAIYLLYLFLVSILSIVVGYFVYGFGVSNGIPIEVFLILLASFILFLTLNQSCLS